MSPRDSGESLTTPMKEQHEQQRNSGALSTSTSTTTFGSSISSGSLSVHDLSGDSVHQNNTAVSHSNDHVKNSAVSSANATIPFLPLTLVAALTAFFWSEDRSEANRSSPPPLHAVATLGALGTVFCCCLPSMRAIDSVATLQTFSTRLFPKQVSLRSMAIIRTVFALFVFAHSFQTTFLYEGWTNMTPYNANTKLVRAEFPVRGYRTQMPFTSWSWNMVGVSFALSAAVTWMAIHKAEAAKSGRVVVVPKPLLRAALMVFEMVAPTTLLVSAVTRYVIWPSVLADTGDTSGLSNARTLLWHNANNIMILIEVAFLGGLPLKLSHCALTPLFGCAYVAFTWLYRDMWVDPDVWERDGSQFMYQFFDTTVGSEVTIALLALLTVLMVFYGLLSGAKSILGWMGGTFVSHLIFATALAGIVCRFQD